MTSVAAETEILQITPSFKELAAKIKLYEYRVEASSEFLRRLEDETPTHYVAGRSDALSHWSKNGEMVVSLTELDVTKLDIPAKLRNEVKLFPLSQGRLVDIAEDGSLIQRLIYLDLRKSIEESGFRVRGYSAYDEAVSVNQGLTARHPVISQILPFIGVHPGFYFRLRSFQDEFFLQVTPKSVLEFTGSLYEVMLRTNLSVEILEELCERVRLPIGSVAALRSILSKTCNDPIYEAPYLGQTYIQYKSALYGREPTLNSDARLALILWRASGNCRYVSLQETKPVLDLQTIGHMDRTYCSQLNGRMRLASSKRRDTLSSLTNRLCLTLFGEKVLLGPRFSRSGELRETTPSTGLFNSHKFIQFTWPDMRFRNKYGNVVDKSRTTGALAAPQDLMNDNYLRPYSLPHEVRIAFLYTPGFYQAAELLRDSLTNLGGKTPNEFQSQFRSSMVVQSLSELGGVFPNCDCAIIVGPRDLSSLTRSRTDYTEAEIAALENGIPAQYVIHSPSTVPSLDLSMERRVADPYFLFGLAISLIAKVGGNSMVLSETALQEFPRKSVIIAYNVARVFEKISDDVRSSDRPLDRAKTSIAVSAAVAMMDQAASEIIHQFPHVIPTESALFSGDRGRLLFNYIPDWCENAIIHKDGPFYSEELNDLKNFCKPGRTTIPVSILTANVPRVTTSVLRDHFRPPPGLVVPLSDNDFLLSTTLFGGRDPVSRGWPNPILVRIHDIESNHLSAKQKQMVLYQIWSLTRSHPASMNPTRRPMSIHYSNKMANFVRKAANPEPAYFRKFAGTKNRFGLYSRPFF